MGRFSLPNSTPAQPSPAAPAPAAAQPAAAAPAPRATPEPAPRPAATAKGAPPSQLDIRLRLHSRLIEELDLAKLDKLDEADLRR